MEKYRINHSTGSVHEYNPDQRAYIFIGNTITFSDEVLATMERMQVNQDGTTKFTALNQENSKEKIKKM